MIKALVVTVFAFLLLQGCSNIPVSTMMKMSGFDEEDFIKLNPEDIRVKVRSNTQVNVLAANQLSYSYKGFEAFIDDCLSLELLKKKLELLSTGSGTTVLNILAGISWMLKVSISLEPCNSTRYYRTRIARELLNSLYELSTLIILRPNLN